MPKLPVAKVMYLKISVDQSLARYLLIGSLKELKFALRLLKPCKGYERAMALKNIF